MGLPNRLFALMSDLIKEVLKMKALKAKFTRFVKDENGMEFIAVACIIAAAVILAGLVKIIYDNVIGTVGKVNGTFELPAKGS